jgi:hypothetical protein
MREAVAAVVPRCSRVSITAETLAEEYAMAPRKVRLGFMLTRLIYTLILILTAVSGDASTLGKQQARDAA